MKLKWNKVEWRKDQKQGTWVHPDDGQASALIELLLDKFHKPIWYKKEKKLKALADLYDILGVYQEKNTDAAALKIIQKRMKSVRKKMIQYKNGMRFRDTIDWDDIKKNPYLVNAFREFCEKEFSSENPNFLMALQEGKNRNYIIDTFIKKKAPQEVNLQQSGAKDGNVAARILAGGDFAEAEEVIKRLVNSDTMRRFRESNLLYEALNSISKFNDDPSNR